MNLIAYYCFEQLSNKRKDANKIKIGAKTPRFDCTFHCGSYPMLDGLKSKRGMLFLYLLASRKRNNITPETYLQCDNINISGLFYYFRNGQITNYCSGYPSNKKLLATNRINPFWEVRNDGFLFIVSKDLQRIEMFIIQDAKPMIDVYLRQLAEGVLTNRIESLRTQSKPYFEY